MRTIYLISLHLATMINSKKIMKNALLLKFSKLQLFDIGICSSDNLACLEEFPFWNCKVT